MRLEHFNYIIEIARYKSMSKASKQLFITQPSLSTAIQSLEEELRPSSKAVPILSWAATIQATERKFFTWQPSTIWP